MKNHIYYTLIGLMIIGLVGMFYIYYGGKSSSDVHKASKISIQNTVNNKPTVKKHIKEPLISDQEADKKVIAFKTHAVKEVAELEAFYASQRPDNYDEHLEEVATKIADIETIQQEKLEALHQFEVYDNTEHQGYLLEQSIVSYDIPPYKQQ